MMRQVKIKKFLFENLKWTAQFIFLFLFFVCFLFALNIKTPFVNVSVKGVVPGKEFSLKKNGYPALRIYNKGQETVKVKISGKVERLKSEKEDNPLLNLPPKRGEKQRGDFTLSTCQLFNLSTKRGKGFGHLNFGNLDLFRIWDFGFRI